MKYELSNFWRITTAELVYKPQKIVTALAAVATVLLAIGSFDSDDMLFGYPQAIFLITIVTFSLIFKEKRDRMLAQLPVSRETILFSRYAIALLLMLAFTAAFVIVQAVIVANMNHGTFLLQAISIAGLSFFTSSIWLFLLELNFLYSRYNLWKLSVALLLIGMLLTFMVFTLDMLDVADTRDRAEFFRHNAAWFLSAVCMISLGLFFITGRLFLRRASFTGKAKSWFMEMKLRDTDIAEKKYE